MKKLWVISTSVIVVIVLMKCSEDMAVDPASFSDDFTGPELYHLKVPSTFPDYFLDKENQLTKEGIALGKRLFFDPILSRNQNVSCGSCHFQKNSFSDPRAKSIGTNSTPTSFHSMPIFNIAWMNEFFWDGRAKSREAQALQPVTNPNEMDLTWKEAEKRLKNHPEYPALFKEAFGVEEIDSNLVSRALVQYEMTLVSADTRFDKWLKGEVELTEKEALGQSIFNSERGDCFHCHGTVLATDNSFHNNGLDNDENLSPGLYKTTGLQEDFGKFKTPTLRNLVFTAPYMHDGRFETLDDVINFYSEGVQNNRNIDVLMEFAFQGGVRLSDPEKEALKAFVLMMTDSSFVQNPELVPLQ
ncbi:MAG: cytochrome c peroxidase [Salibacteraceae bacterium]